MDDRIYLSLLYDFYGELLDGQKKQIFEDYIMHDLSLGEIAGDAGISRQGVHDCIKRCGRKLIEYEEALHLVERFEAVKKQVDEIKTLSDRIRSTRDFEMVGRIEQIAQEILDAF